MVMDPLLLARLRDRGIDDARIRHLHDTVETGSSRMRNAAIHLMSDIVDGPVRHYTREEGLTAELALGTGLHWTGRALRMSSPRSIPTTTLAALPGQRLSAVVDFPGAADHVVTGADVDASGNTWVTVDAAKVVPPARGGPISLLRHMIALRSDDNRRSARAIVCHGGFGAAVCGAAILAMFLLPVWLMMITDPSKGVGMGIALVAVVGLVFTLPWPERWKDPDETHLRDMKALQEAQGW